MRQSQRYIFTGILLLLLAALGWGGLSLSHLVGNPSSTVQASATQKRVTRQAKVVAASEVSTKVARPTVTPTATKVPSAIAQVHHSTAQRVQSRVSGKTSSTGSLFQMAIDGKLNGMVGARLIIPAIGLNVLIESVGVNADGSLQTPSAQPWTAAGWYENGPQPGQPGNAVIDGHLDRPGGYPATFWNLRYLQPGDKVIVQDSDGNAISFHVTALRTYGRTASANDVFVGGSTPVLNLITCSGTWIPAIHETTTRLVVSTVLD